ncbi:hypothetical protein KO528_15410 [Saccharophagus degradans]|uniref:Uncharacterized protein n=1 Tax=Saccharophagus degradans TaxID=86304 RepID=A0AAW7X8Q3_9GAMM|nr:hypothetical protein [Saccharophagus degradans]MBU2986752.1 hypothetical protein [Saccharophagus degradans]MDO6422749.1 hypothetical protein [Saccharophagus degradans]MDO6606222.1 hypothetical protein [Saccharophagus degradans]WGO98484.1 hypothetical protein QFX18_00200 [Saccharophagus degradans]
MKKLLVALVATLASAGLTAGEVDASNPSSAAEEIVVAIAETGVSSSWTSEAFEGKATAHDIAELNENITQMNKRIGEALTFELDIKVAEKASVSFEE